MIDLSKIELKHKNAHDVEDVALCDFLRFFNTRIESLLDVGAHDSRRHYCRDARSILSGRYEGIDVLDDPDTALLIDKYHVGNFMNKYDLNPFDAVISISAIEHSGLTTYRMTDHKAERYRVLDKIFAHSFRFVFLTFPFGQDGMVEGQYSNITNKELVRFDRIADDEENGFSILAKDFYYCQHPQMGLPWEQISREDCAKIPLNPAIEQQTVAVCSWMKT